MITRATDCGLRRWATVVVGALLGALVPVSVMVPTAGSSVAAPLEPAAATVQRIAGADRFDVAASVSQRAFPDGAPIVFIANGLTFPDALSGAPAAALQGGPVLLTTSTALPASIEAELRRLHPASIVLLGGPVSLSPELEQRLAEFAPVIERIAGPDRYAVSRSIAERYFGTASTVFIATGRGFPDALAGAGAAAALGAPVVLVDGTVGTLPEATELLLRTIAPDRIVILGGPVTVVPALEAAVAELAPEVQRIGGADRFAVSVAISQQFVPAATTALMTTGLNFPDALTGAALAAAGAPLYLVPPGCPTPAVLDDALDRLVVDDVIILGGERSVSPDVELLDGCAARVAERSAAERSLVRSIGEVDAAHAGVYSVTVRELSGLRVSVSVGGSLMQEPASVMKLYVAYAVLDRVDRGLLSLSSPVARSGLSVETCLRAILHISDNYCHWDLVETVGAQAINNQLSAEGYTGTGYGGYHPASGQYLSSKVSTTDDVALLLERLERGELLSPESTERMIGLMETQLWRYRIPSGLPPGVAIANKTGHLWTTQYGFLHADVAIVDAPDGRYIVTIIGRGNATAAGVRDMGRRVWEHLVGPVPQVADYSGANSVTTAALNMRTQPSTSSPVITVIPSGTELSADAGVRDWYVVFYAGQYGYVHSSFLRNRYDYPQRQ